MLARGYETENATGTRAERPEGPSPVTSLEKAFPKLTKVTAPGFFEGTSQPMSSIEHQHVGSVQPLGQRTASQRRLRLSVHDHHAAPLHTGQVVVRIESGHGKFLKERGTPCGAAASPPDEGSEEDAPPRDPPLGWPPPGEGGLEKERAYGDERGSKGLTHPESDARRRMVPRLSWEEGEVTNVTKEDRGSGRESASA